MENEEKDTGPKPKPTEFESPRQPLKEVKPVEEPAEEDPAVEEPEPEPKSEEEPALEPEEQKEQPKKTVGLSRRQRLKRWYLSHKKISIPASLLILLLILAAIPFTRFAIAGTVVAHDIEVKVLDSKTGAPVSDASVRAGSGSAGKTNGTGQATIKNVKPGPTTIEVTKKYYKDGNLRATVPVINPSKPFSTEIEAIGRQVKIAVTDIVSQKPLAEVEIAISDVKAQTDQFGNAVVVVPVGPASYEATLALKGYNESKMTVQVSDTEIKQNDFKLTPTGRVYFLSTRSGNVDVLSANLDGTDTKTVLAGTGKEDEDNTVLLASNDWKYLALYANRDGARAKLYIITTSDDKLTTADEGSADFTLYGWLGSSVVYSISRTDLSPWQVGAGKLKAYDASSGKITTLDQTAGSGNVNSNIHEYYSFVFLAGGDVVYAKSWTTQSSDSADFTGKEDKLSSISSNGQNHKVIASYDAATKTTDFVAHKPNSIYILTSTQETDDYTYFDYVIGSPPKQISLTLDEFYSFYPTFYHSPDGKKTAWTETRDGKKALIVANSDGENEKAVAMLDEHTAFGWFTNQYLLVAKNGSELAIISADGGASLKLANYQSGTYYGVAR